MILDKSGIVALELEPADIIRVKGNGPMSLLAHSIFAPYTDRHHHALVWSKSGDDYIILESVSKGLAVGRLSMYAGADVTFYRAVNLDFATRERACDELTRYGRAPYDYALYIRLVRNIIKAELSILRSGRWFRKLHAYELPYREDGWLVCTEAVALAFRLVNWSLVPDGVMALPSAIEQASLDGLIREVTA
ncbi:MAG: hypothetical protein KKD77_24000 [Gammaproteobacteria bacterium]|nr:hypothetical protein [Gammaproteobacteria bacterium]